MEKLRRRRYTLEYKREAISLGGCLGGCSPQGLRSLSLPAENVSRSELL